MRISDWISDVCSSDMRPRSDEAFHARTIDQQDLDPGLVLELSGPRLDARDVVLCGVDVFGELGHGGALRQPSPAIVLPAAYPAVSAALIAGRHELGRASWRERVGPYG